MVPTWSKVHKGNTPHRTATHTTVFSRGRDSAATRDKRPFAWRKRQAKLKICRQKFILSSKFQFFSRIVVNIFNLAQRCRQNFIACDKQIENIIAGWLVTIFYVSFNKPVNLGHALDVFHRIIYRSRVYRTTYRRGETIVMNYSTKRVVILSTALHKCEIRKILHIL